MAEAVAASRLPTSSCRWHHVKEPTPLSLHQSVVHGFCITRSYPGATCVSMYQVTRRSMGQQTLTSSFPWVLHGPSVSPARVRTSPSAARCTWPSTRAPPRRSLQPLPQAFQKQTADSTAKNAAVVAVTAEEHPAHVSYHDAVIGKGAIVSHRTCFTKGHSKRAVKHCYNTEGSPQGAYLGANRRPLDSEQRPRGPARRLGASAAACRCRARGSAATHL